MNLIGAIAAAVLNSLWQSMILAFLIWAALKLAPPRMNAATRHVIWWIALAAVVALPCIPRRTPPSAAPPPPPVRANSLPVRVAAPFVAEPAAPVTVTERHSAVWPICVAAIWFAVLLYRSWRIAGSYSYLRGIKRRAMPRDRMPAGAMRRGILLLSREISSPIAVGFLHPAVILPDGLPDRLSAGELECVLLHEAAHLARYDDWTNLGGRALAAAIGLHPVAAWILRQIEREREMACDDWVVAHTGAAVSYAESLVRIVGMRMAPAESVLASGIFSRPSRLRARIELLLRGGREFSPVAARRTVVVAAGALAVLFAAAALAPHWIAFAQRPQFEVVSLKRNDPNVRMGMDSFPRRSGDLLVMHNTQMWSMLVYAYHIRGRYQVVGYKDFPDDWRWYDLDARIGREATDDDVRQMMQSMLEDRFKLKVHRETQEIPEYLLSLGKGKPRLSEPVEGPTMTVTIEGKNLPTRKGDCAGTLWNDGNHITCHAAGIDKLAVMLTGELGAPLADHTGLTGVYDLHIHFAPEKRRMEPALELEPTVEQAIAEQLGLKLEKGKGPVEVLVIDHMEKPSEN